MTDNELIAEFDGWVYDEKIFPNNGRVKWIHPTKSTWITETIVLPSSVDKFENYQTSWDWLMPIVERIESLPIGGFPSEFCIKYNRCDLLVNVNPKELRENFGVTANSKIEAVYKAVVEFIRWYQNQKNG